MESRSDLGPFAAWLRSRMRERRLGQNQLGVLMGVSSSAVSEYVRARRRPRLETLRKLAGYFAVPLEELEALLPAEAPEPAAATAGGDPASARTLIRETVMETLAQMGHPRVAADREPPLPKVGPFATVTEAIDALDMAFVALPPEVQEKYYTPELRRLVKATRRRVLAAEGA